MFDAESVLFNLSGITYHLKTMTYCTEKERQAFALHGSQDTVKIIEEN